MTCPYLGAGKKVEAKIWNPNYGGIFHNLDFKFLILQAKLSANASESSTRLKRYQQAREESIREKNRTWHKTWQSTRQVH